MYELKRKRLLVNAAIIIGVICKITIASSLPKSFLDTEAILDGWESNYGSIKNARVSYTEQILDVDISNTNIPDEFAKRLRSDSIVKNLHVERIQDGEKYHARISTAEDGFANPQNLQEYAFDGKATREYTGSENLGVIRSGLTGKAPGIMRDLKPYMLMQSYLSEKYLKEYPNGISTFSRLLKNPVAKLRVNLESINGELCHVIDIITKSSTTGIEFEYRIWVAHDKGFLPLKYQSYKNKKLTEEIVVEEIGFTETENGRIWYPAKAYRTRDNRLGKTKKKLVTHLFTPNVKVDENTFKFDFPSGTHIIDHILGLEYIVGVGNFAEMPPVYDIQPDEKQVDDQISAMQGIQQAKILEKKTESITTSDKLSIKVKNSENDKTQNIPLNVSEENKPLAKTSILAAAIVIIAILGVSLFCLMRKNTRRKAA